MSPLGLFLSHITSTFHLFKIISYFLTPYIICTYFHDVVPTYATPYHLAQATAIQYSDLMALFFFIRCHANGENESTAEWERDVTRRAVDVTARLCRTAA